jgi:hypothetical protein
MVPFAPDDGGKRLLEARDIVGGATERLIENAGWRRRRAVISGCWRF